MSEEPLKVRIKVEVPVTIFELPKIKVRVDQLFSDLESDIKLRFDEIKAFITQKDSKGEYSKISYDEVAEFFKMYFYKSILNEVVVITFTEVKCDVAENIIALLSEEKLKAAILGEPMISAFEKGMDSIPTKNGIVRGSKKLLLEKVFLGIPVPGTKL